MRGRKVDEIGKREECDQKAEHDLSFISHHGEIIFRRQERERDAGAVKGRDRDHVERHEHEIEQGAQVKQCEEIFDNANEKRVV